MFVLYELHYAVLNVGNLGSGDIGLLDFGSLPKMEFCSLQTIFQNDLENGSPTKQIYFERRIKFQIILENRPSTKRKMVMPTKMNDEPKSNGPMPREDSY